MTTWNTSVMLLQIPSIRYNSVARTGHNMMGVTQNIPIAPVWTNPMTVTIIENSDFETYKDFKKWFDDTAAGIDQQWRKKY